MSGLEQSIGAAAGRYETQLEKMLSLTHDTVKFWQQMIGLGLSAAQAGATETSHATQRLLKMEHSSEWMAQNKERALPAIDKTLLYFEKAGSLLSITQASLLREAQANAAAGTQTISHFIDSFTGKAPSGSECALSVLALGQNGARYQQLSKATEQAGRIMEVCLFAAARQVSQLFEAGK